jgi:hypothetical protein
MREWNEMRWNGLGGYEKFSGYRKLRTPIPHILTLGYFGGWINAANRKRKKKVPL